MTRDIQLWVRVDDAASSWLSNMGCLRVCTEGIARSVEVIKPCPWTAHAATLPAAHQDIDIGIQLTLTREWSLDDMVQEFQAQITLGVVMFPDASHVSSQMIERFKDFDSSLERVTADLCQDHGLADEVFGHALPTIKNYPSFPKAAGPRSDPFERQLPRLEASTYIFVDRPAEASAELGVLGHDDVAADRASCLETLINPRVRACVDACGIDLISYKDLR